MSRNKKYSDSWLLLAIVLLAATAPAFSMFKVAPVMDSVMADLSITAAEGGLISTSFSLVPIFLSIPVGVIVSKYGNWKFGLLALFSVAAGSAISSISTGMPPLLLARVIEGVGMALIGTVAPNIVNAIFRPEKRGMAMGILMCYISLGQAFINKLAPVLSPSADSWRNVWWFVTVYAIVFLVLWFFFLRNVDTNETAEVQTISVGNALKNSSMWFIAIAMFFFMLAMQGILMFYTSYFVQAKNLELSYAASICGYHGLAGCVGAVISGIIMDKLHTKKIFGIAVMIIAAALFLMVPAVPAKAAALQVIVVGFVVNLFPPIVFASMPEVCDNPTDIPISIGVANTLQNFGSLIAGIIVGAIIDSIGWNGVFIYAAVMAVCSAVCFMMVKKIRR
ncbi:MAG: MFS transporter [Frisingicoccus sp.]|uniref:MFS transporter n=1 Tax=Frisingicoccus sp. TaxID=1918627 RepID=UPI00262EE67D|nr:MFS transporter [Frisingicoccus sp.]MDD6232206.1 MFS transporter [Frisingicoccus sp.]